MLLRYLFIFLPLYCINLFGISIALQEANELFNQNKYEEAYTIYAEYLYTHGNHTSIQDYYIAFIGFHESIQLVDMKFVQDVYSKYINKFMTRPLTKTGDRVRNYIKSHSIYKSTAAPDFWPSGAIK